MDTFKCIQTKLDYRNFSKRAVPDDVKLKILEAARLTGTGLNSQHWRFILVQDTANLWKLAQDSTTGKWVSGANFAVIVLSSPKYNYHLIDVGRAVQDMGLAAWNFGVISCIFTGFDRMRLKRDFEVPDDIEPAAVMGFGYPARKIIGLKSRKPLSELAFLESYGNPIRLHAQG